MIKRIAFPALLLAALFHVSSRAGSAQELITDRPDQTESAVTIPAGLLQLETGWNLSSAGDNASATRSLEAFGTLLRIGLAERWELRLGWGGWIEEKHGEGPAATRVDGAGDAEVGAKLAIFEERGARPEMALLFGAGLPVGSDAVTAHRIEPSFRLLLAHSLGDDWSLGVNLGAAWATEEAPEDAGRSTQSRAIYTAAVGRGIGEHWGVFVELFGDLGGSAGGPPAHSFDSGVTWLLSPRLQLDLAGGVGLSRAADNWFIGIGLSLRTPR